MKGICCKCGRTLPGVDVAYSKINSTLCPECSGDETSAAHCCCGDKVMYTATANVPEVALVAANMFLKVGDTYEVAETMVLNDAVRLKFVGRNYWFRSELFRRIPNANI